MLKRVRMICANCNQMGLAQIDTTEDVLLMICRCPECGMREGKEKKPAAEKVRKGIPTVGKAAEKYAILGGN